MNSGIADVREGRTRERTSWQREQRWNGVLGHVGYLMLLKEERLRTGFLPCAELSESSVPGEPSQVPSSVRLKHESRLAFWESDWRAS